MGLIKAAIGRGDLLTRQERGAIAGLRTKQGAAYFQVRDGRTGFTPEGIAELRVEQPLIGDLIAKPAAEVARNGRTAVSVPGPSSLTGPAGSGMRVTPADVNAAAHARDARQRLGDVRAGRLHALEAYRGLSEKKAAKGNLSSEEQSKLDWAGQALAAALDRGGRQAGFAPGVKVRGSSENPYADPDVDDVFDNGFPASPAYDALISQLKALRAQLAEARREQMAKRDAMGRVDDAAPSAQVEYARLQAEEEAAEARVEDLIEQAREALRPLPKTGRRTAFHGDAKLLGQADLGSEVVRRYVSDKLIPEELEVTYDPDKRGGHFDGRIFINEELSASRIAHEIVHELEVIHKDILKRTKDFLERRGKTGEKGSLQQRTGSSDYGPSEEAWFDLWKEKGGHEYSGKDCGPAATEILTVGIERLHHDPILFMLTDPEYFEFVVRTLNPR